jgi:hypothetical protein
MGVVYRAYDPVLDRAVAIKLVRESHPKAGSHLRLLREAQALARLRHPNVVPIFDVGQTEGAVFLAMPLLEGGTLRSWLSDPQQTFDSILDQFLAAGRGLAAAHAAGLVHRDFKPDNVLLGSGGEIYVADFGLARLADDVPPPEANAGTLVAEVMTQTGAVLGTPRYMAPEQLRGLPTDERADQFSFCVALWEAVLGERPFREPADDAAHPVPARLEAIAAGLTPPPRRHDAAWIVPLLVRGLDVDPERRWPTLQALLDAISARRGGRRWPRRSGIAASAVGVTATIVALAWPRRSELPPRFHLEPLAYTGDLRSAALSPDGGKLAVVAGDSLMIGGTTPQAKSRVIVPSGIGDVINDEPARWSPDGTHVLVFATPETLGVSDVALVNVDDGTVVKLPTKGMATFLSSTEIATWTFRERAVSIFRVGGRAAISSCEVPGEYTFLLNVIGTSDGTMVVEIENGNDASSLVFLERSCRVIGRFSSEPVSSAASSDTGTVVAVVAHGGVSDVVELSRDGAMVSRRRLRGAVETILGRRHGTDYVSTLTPRTHLVRVHGGGPPTRVLSLAGYASFSLAPDGETLAWVEDSGNGLHRGRLRLLNLHDLSRPGRALLDNVLMVGWSPDGRSLAALVDNDPGSAERLAPRRPGSEASLSLIIVDRGGDVSRRMRIDNVMSEAAPVWLDDHRIAVLTADRTTYRWFDLDTNEQGKIVDGGYGSTYWLTRSPRDGTLSMWRNGPPGQIDARPEHIWLQTVDRPAHPLHVTDAARHFLMPTWSPSGELLVRALETGVVSRVVLETGELIPVARLPAVPMRRLFDEHLMTLLAVDIDRGCQIMVVAPDAESQQGRR